MAQASPNLNRKTQTYSQLTFTKNQLSEIFRTSRSVISEMEKDGLIKGIEVQTGATKKKVYDWTAVQALASKFSDRISRPSENKIKVFEILLQNMRLEDPLLKKHCHKEF